MGRPRKYTDKLLRKELDRYFRSITREKTLTEKIDSGRKDSYGHTIWMTVPITNMDGEEVTQIEYIVPPTVGGICDFLHISRQTWCEYCDKNKHPEFLDTTTQARERLRAWNEMELLTRQGKDLKGIMFNLQNNYDYRERTEIEVGEKAAKAMSGNLTLQEKMQMLREIGREFGNKDADDAL